MADDCDSMFYGAPVYVRHEIVHNKEVVQSLKKIGAIFVEELDEIKDKTRPVIFSAHGVPKKVPIEAENFKMEYVDATCPLVSKVHREAENLNKNGLQILLIGHKNHPEVIGTMGQIPEGEIDLIENVDDANNYENKSKKKLAFVTQTTLSVDDTKEIISALKKKFPKDIIKKSGNTVLDIPDGHLCCGSAGTYNILPRSYNRSNSKNS